MREAGEKKEKGEEGGGGRKGGEGGRSGSKVRKIFKGREDLGPQMCSKNNGGCCILFWFDIFGIVLFDAMEMDLEKPDL